MEIRNLKVLVAEDNQMNIFLMKKVLAKWGITADFAINGFEAVKAYQTNTYDVILMDLKMPLMDGYQAASIIRNDNSSLKSKIPIIALTASLASEVKGKMAEAGIDDIITKPFNLDVLKFKLQEIALGSFVTQGNY